MPASGKARAQVFVEIFLDAALLVLFVGQAFLLSCLLLFGHIPLPTSWTSKIVSRQLPADLTLDAGSYNLTLDGTIEIDSLSLHANGFSQAIFVADGAIVSLGGWSNLKPGLEELVLSNGELKLPAVYSPSGQNESMLERIAFSLGYEDGMIQIESFAALHQDIRLRGSFEWPFSMEGGGSGDIDDESEPFINGFFEQAAFIIKQKSRIEGLNQPTLLFQIAGNEDNSFKIQTTIGSRELKLPGLEARNITLDADLIMSGASLVNRSSLLFEADYIEIPEYDIQAQAIQALIDSEEWEALLQGDWPNMEIAARQLSFDKIELDSPQITVAPQAFQEVNFRGTTSGLDGVIEFSGGLNIKTRSARVRAAGSVDLLSIAGEKTTAQLPPIELSSAPYYNLSLQFGEGFALESARLKARIDDLDIKGIPFGHIRVEGSFSNGVYDIENLYLRRDWQWLNLGFNLDSSTHDYRVRLVGFAKPYDYNDILPHWWAGIFRDFSFEEIESGLGDFIIYGNTRKRAADLFFGHARATKVSYKDVMIDEGELIVRGRGPYAEVHRLNGRSGKGYARGDIRFASRLDYIRGPMSLRMDLETKLPLNDAQKLFDENIAGIIADFSTDALPETRLQGAIFNKAYQEYTGKSYIDLSASCPSPVTYNGIPLDSIQFELFGRNQITYLRNMRIGYADGDGVAQVDILTPEGSDAQARFSFELSGADQAKTIQALNSLDDEPEAREELDEVKDSEGVIALRLNAKGPVDDPLQFQGYGEFSIFNKALSSIDLFGPLSRLLKNTRLGFTSFALQEMDGEFNLQENIIEFTKLEINGPRTKIEAPGTLQLENLTLAMRVSVYLFGNAGNPNSTIRRISDMITKPIPNLLEFELSGTPDSQKWRSLYDPRKLIPQF
ncbi:MAG: hypothetical protein AAF065_05145 [Verrucomicrobiota bacterium]